mgnify:CR=1 FL=1
MTDTKIAVGARVRVIKARYNFWTPDGLKDGDTGFITRTTDGGSLVDFKRDDGTMYRGLVAERFEVIQEEKPSSFSRTGWPEMPDEIREDLHGPWSPQVNKAYWHGRAVSDAWAEVQLERLKNNAQEDAVNYKYAFSAELRGRNTVQTDGLVILNPPPKVYISVIATGYEEAIETALGVLPDFSKMSFDWALDVTSIEVQD